MVGSTSLDWLPAGFVRGTRRVWASTASGILLGFSFEGAATDPLFALVAFVPLGWFLLVSHVSLRATVVHGWWTGLVGGVLSCYWVPGSFVAFSGSTLAWGSALFLLFASIEGFAIAVLATLYRGFVLLRVRPILALPFAAMLAEWAVPVPLEYHLGTSLHTADSVLQLAGVGGPLLLTALVGFTNGCLVEICEGSSKLQRARSAWIVLLSVWMVVLSYGMAELRVLRLASDDAPQVLVAAIQGGLNLSEKHVDANSDIRVYAARTEAVLDANPDIDLVVWPETVVAYRFDLAAGALDRRLFPDPLGVPLLFGGFGREEAGGKEVAFNSAFLAGPNLEILGSYEKQKLFPLSERIPLLSVLKKISDTPIQSAEFGLRKTSGTLVVGPMRIGVLICYDEVDPHLAKEAVDSGANLIVSLSNDAWFGKSIAASQHLALAKLRAAESQRALVRATNTGVTAIIRPTGKVESRLPLEKAADLIGSVPLLDQRPLSAALGPWVGPVVLLLAALSVIWSRVSRQARDRKKED